MFYVSVCPLSVTLLFASDGDFWSKQFLGEEEKYTSLLGFSHMNMLIIFKTGNIAFLSLLTINVSKTIKHHNKTLKDCKTQPRVHLIGC